MPVSYKGVINEKKPVYSAVAVCCDLFSGVVGVVPATATLPGFLHCMSGAAGGPYRTLTECEALISSFGGEWLFGAFEVGEKLSFSLTSGKTEIFTEVFTVECSNDKGGGEIRGLHILALAIAFTGCHLKGTTTYCSGIGRALGEIVTNTLTGNLGETNAGTKAGLLFSPEQSLAPIIPEFSCGIVKTTVTGTVIGEVRPINSFQNIVEVAFSEPNIREITILGGKATGGLRAFGNTAALTSTESLSADGPIEIT